MPFPPGLDELSFLQRLLFFLSSVFFRSSTRNHSAVDSARNHFLVLNLRGQFNRQAYLHFMHACGFNYLESFESLDKFRRRWRFWRRLLFVAAFSLALLFVVYRGTRVSAEVLAQQRNATVRGILLSQFGLCERTATPHAVHRSYRRLMRALHPDKRRHRDDEAADAALRNAVQDLASKRDLLLSLLPPRLTASSTEAASESPPPPTPPTQTRAMTPPAPLLLGAAPTRPPPAPPLTLATPPAQMAEPPLGWLQYLLPRPVYDLCRLSSAILWRFLGYSAMHE